MSALRLLSCDPGEFESALVIVEPAGRHGVRLMRSAMVTPDAFPLWLKECDLVAVEKAEGGARPFAVKHLLVAQWVGGELAGMARGRGLPVLTASASEVRQAVIGKLPRAPRGITVPGNTADQWIARALPNIVQGMDTRTSVHVRDALVLAVWAARKVWGAR